MLVYIISDINKSLQLEWTLKNINKKLKLKVILINCKDSKLQFFLSKNRIEYQNIKFNKKYLDFLPAILKIILTLYNWNTSIIHCHLRKASILGLVAGYFLGIKQRVYTRHHGNQDANLFYEKLIDKVIFYISTDIVAISDVTKKLTIQNYQKSKKKITKIYHGFNLDYFKSTNQIKLNFFKKKYQINDKDFVVGVISRLEESKNISNIIESFAKFNRKYKNSILILANINFNSAYGKKIQRKLNMIPKKNLRLIKFEEDIKNLYLCFDVFIHVPKSKNFEAFGQVYIEAMLFKIPSIFSESGILNEISNHLKNSFLCDPNNKNQIFKSLEYLKINDHKFKFLTINAYRLAVKKFSLHKHLEKLYRLYT